MDFELLQRFFRVCYASSRDFIYITKIIAQLRFFMYLQGMPFGVGKRLGLDFGVGVEKYLQSLKKVSKIISVAKKLLYPNNLPKEDKVNLSLIFPDGIE